MLERLQEIVRRYAGDNNMIITGDTVLLADLGLDSLELIEMVCEIEKEFDVDIPDREINGFKTMQHVYDYLAKHS